MPETKQISITIPADILEKLREDATENYRSLSAEIAYVASVYFKQKES